jgi:hypothetical protein
MSVYYRLFWQDIQFKSVEMKEKERERERKKKWISGDGGGALVSNTHKSQSILIHIVQQAPLSPLEPNGNHFFLLSLSLSRSNSSRGVVFTIKFILARLYRPVFSLTYLHHLYVNRPFLIRCHARFSSRYLLMLSLSLFLSGS